MEDLLIVVVILALFFDFTNGFHDTANAIATSVSTRALKPRTAVLWAAILNFIGAFVSLKVAATVAKGVVEADAITLPVVFAGIIGAILWNLFTWRVGMPTSSSHALIGGVAGSAVAALGWDVVKWQGLLDKVVIPSLVAPLVGIALAGLIMFLIFRLVPKTSDSVSDRIFRKLQIVSASFVAFTHGTNDAQKTMGIIALALLAVHPAKEFSIPTWVIFSAAAAMALGTYIGGWRIIHTLGQRIVHLRPREGFAAETATASILWTTAQMGFPVSTTHTISSSIVGAGAVENRHGINWSVIKQILIAWLFTLPCAALVGAGAHYLSGIDGGTYLTFALLAVIAWTILWTQHWDKDVWRQFRARLRSVDNTPTQPVTAQVAVVAHRTKHAVEPSIAKHPLKSKATAKPSKKRTKKPSSRTTR